MKFLNIKNRSDFHVNVRVNFTFERSELHETHSERSEFMIMNLKKYLDSDNIAFEKMFMISKDERFTGEHMDVDFTALIHFEKESDLLAFNVKYA